MCWSVTSRMLHHTLADRYVRQRTMYGRLLRMCFALAGMFWIVIYLQPIEAHAALRSGQSVIYFILMTVWGLDYMREQRRLTLIITAANQRGIPPCELEFAAVADRASLFSMLTPSRGIAGIVFPVIFTAGLATAYVLVILQYFSALSGH
jgi:hypothetical protein